MFTNTRPESTAVYRSDFLPREEVRLALRVVRNVLRQHLLQLGGGRQGNQQQPHSTLRLQRDSGPFLLLHLQLQHSEHRSRERSHQRLKDFTHPRNMQRCFASLTRQRVNPLPLSRFQQRECQNVSHQVSTRHQP